MLDIMPEIRALVHAVLRIEKKLDEIFKLVKASSQSQPLIEGLDYKNQVCPMCKKPVEYRPIRMTMDSNYVERICGCSVRREQLDNLTPRE